VGAGAAANFLLLHGPAGLHDSLRERGVAVRPCDSFPGLGPGWVRTAVRDGASNAQLLAVLATGARPLPS
jgi:histidinol-phosphate/aromatic aminotransferase/cobyric acid decarboxylase-like protein